VVNLSPALRHFGSQMSWDSFESDSLCRGGSAQPTCVAVHRTAEQRGVAGPSSYITTTHLIGLVFCKMTTAQRSQDRRAGAARSRKPNDHVRVGSVDRPAQPTWRWRSTRTDLPDGFAGRVLRHPRRSASRQEASSVGGRPGRGATCTTVVNSPQGHTIRPPPLPVASHPGAGGRPPPRGWRRVVGSTFRWRPSSCCTRTT
jgi:hypothetical protein